MTPPEEAARRFLLALLAGMVLGAVYGFLRPLRPKRTALADGFFVLAMLSGWLYVHFKVCGADIRPVYNLAMVLGGFLWECTAG